MLRPANVIVSILFVAAMACIWLGITRLRAIRPTGAFDVKVAEQQSLSPAGQSTALITLFSPVAPQGSKFPVLVYFSDWDGTRIQNRRLLEDLASHGFVVVAVTYPSAGPGMDFSSQTAFDTTLRNANERVQQRVQDAERVLDWLGSSNLSGIADTSRAGILGYSFGGAVAADACVTYPHYKAALNIDGWRFGEALKSAVSCPYMLITDDAPVPVEADLTAKDPVQRYSSILDSMDNQREMADHNRPDTYWVVVNGVDHAGFTEPESGLPSLLPSLGDKEPFPRNLEILRTYTLIFFSKYLLGSNQQLSQGQDKDFSNVQVLMHQTSGH
ncbi:alpha/beta hydrolase family protein [Methylovirgula sp. 4M-Z18]|uniref:alpha/beta hydrolase family protein n=1 Tax=Methylovirgula sp. 4M-Z18 TaxID=2293567 RepID=UPI000E2E5CF1|nr:dienelactone hydrolase family protein [Methylovirgula sp. 4M-Z18]RFB78682.1 hypothetical protein DYH55_15915 [Methylovirgula sp. 4M-Z18]